MRYPALLLSVVAVISLNVILLMGAIDDALPSRDAFDLLVAVLDLSLVSSSVLLGILFVGRRERVLGAVFFLNLVIMGLAFVLRTLGVAIAPMVLFAADIYWLNLYLICLSRHFDTLFLPGLPVDGTKSSPD